MKLLTEKLKNYDVVLASASPRRRQLLEQMGLKFRLLPKHIREDYPEGLDPSAVAEHLSSAKALAFSDDEFSENTLIITADTVVALNGTILGKPSDREDAIKILHHLSGKTHDVITAVSLRSKRKMVTFSVTTRVEFKVVATEEITYYVDNYKPYDKAGAYGIQEWIGHVAIEKIDGSYFNVMGLPTHRLYEELMRFV